MKSPLRAVSAGRWVRRAEAGLTLAGVLALGYAVAVLVSARYFQSTQAAAFARRVATQSARRALPADFAGPIERGSAIGRLDIPRLHLSVIVVEGDGEPELRRAAGHIPGTALPGRSGNIGIAGHRDTFFRPLRCIRPDDTITLTSLAGVRHYRVVSTAVVSPRETQVLHPTANDRLTLVTCFPFRYLGPAPQRFIVRAE